MLILVLVLTSKMTIKTAVMHKGDTICLKTSRMRTPTYTHTVSIV